MTEPRFSVVIPVKNGAATIDAQLRALFAQRVDSPWELVVVDNGSTDGTREIVEAWRARLPLRLVVAADREGASEARNTGAASARSERLLFCDADDVVQPGWIRAMLEALESADLVGGQVRDDLLADEADGGGPPWGDAYPTDRLPTASGGPPFAPGANFAVRREVSEAIGGWDPAMLTAEDIDFSWRAQEAGFRLAFAPSAVVAYRHRSRARDVARQAFVYGRSRRQLQARHRNATPGRRRAALGVLATGAALTRDLILRPWSRRRRLLWLRWAAYLIGWLSLSQKAARSPSGPLQETS